MITTVRNRNEVHNKIRSRRNSTCICYQNAHFQSAGRSRYKQWILTVVFYECERWFLTLRTESYRNLVQVFEKKVHKNLFGPKTKEVLVQFMMHIKRKLERKMYC